MLHLQHDVRGERQPGLGRGKAQLKPSVLAPHRHLHELRRAVPRRRLDDEARRRRAHLGARRHLDVVWLTDAEEGGDVGGVAVGGGGGAVRRDARLAERLVAQDEHARARKGERALEELGAEGGIARAQSMHVHAIWQAWQVALAQAALQRRLVAAFDGRVGQLLHSHALLLSERQQARAEEIVLAQ